MNFKHIIPAIAITICGSLTFAQDNCPKNFDSAKSTKMYNALTSTKKYKTYHIDKDTLQRLSSKPLATRALKVGGIIKFSTGKSPKGNGDGSYQCCYTYSTSKRDILAGKSKTTSESECPVNRVCFCMGKVIQGGKDVTNYDQGAGGGGLTQNTANLTKAGTAFKGTAQAYRRQQGQQGQQGQ